LTAFDLEILGKLVIAAVLGLIIGLEREMKHKPVGLKTCLIISIVSCLLTVVSIESAYKAAGSEDVNISMDPLRLAAQIVSGIGFLGAGVILRRGNDKISGLTTAAIIWGAAGIGIAVGANFYFEAIAGVILFIISVEFLPELMTRIGPKALREKDISLEITVSENRFLEQIIDSLKKNRFSIQRIRIRDLKEGKHLISLKIGISRELKITEVYHMFSAMPGVELVEIESMQ